MKTTCFINASELSAITERDMRYVLVAKDNSTKAGDIVRLVSTTLNCAIAVTVTRVTHYPCALDMGITFKPCEYIESPAKHFDFPAPLEVSA